MMRQTKVALVLGDAAGVMDDVNAALDLGEVDGVVGCNIIGIHWPKAMEAWVSLHPENFKPWAEGRRRRGHPPHRRMFGQADTPHRFPGQTSPGSSGLFAVKVALDDLKFDRVVLCGIPMTQHGSNISSPGKPWVAAQQYLRGWEQALPHIKDRVRSMSGWTADLLGRPTEEWFND